MVAYYGFRWTLLAVKYVRRRLVFIVIKAILGAFPISEIDTTESLQMHTDLEMNNRLRLKEVIRHR